MNNDSQTAVDPDINRDEDGSMLATQLSEQPILKPNIPKNADHLILSKMSESYKYPTDLKSPVMRHGSFNSTQ